jgi:hypothetical protein
MLISTNILVQKVFSVQLFTFAKCVYLSVLGLFSTDVRFGNRLRCRLSYLRSTSYFPQSTGSNFGMALEMNHS